MAALHFRAPLTEFFTTFESAPLKGFLINGVVFSPFSHSSFLLKDTLRMHSQLSIFINVEI